MSKKVLANLIKKETTLDLWNFGFYKIHDFVIIIIIMFLSYCACVCDCIKHYLGVQ